MQDRLLESECKIISVMTVVCGDGKHTWVDFEAVRQPTRASFFFLIRPDVLSRSQEPLSDCNRSKAADGVLFIQPSGAGTGGRGSGWRLAAAHQNRLPAVVHRGPPRTKSVFSRDRGPACWPLYFCEQPREKGKAQSAGKGPLER